MARRDLAPVDRQRAIPQLSDLLKLARPKLATLGLVVVVLAYVAAKPEPFDVGRFALLILGSTLALCGASALNQVMERNRDALMKRTAERPIPTGRVSPLAAGIYGVALSVSGLVLLVPVGVLTTLVAAGGLASYLLIYTPMKPYSSTSTLIGAVPGAVPALMGWTAATGGIDARGWSLFAILFLWQVPHFLAIAWMYRSDYSRAGFATLADDDATGGSTARQIVVSCALLAPVGVMPTVLGMTGGVYFIASLALAAYFLVFAIRFQRSKTGDAARRTLRASVIYLPALLAVLVFDVIVLH